MLDDCYLKEYIEIRRSDVPEVARLWVNDITEDPKIYKSVLEKYDPSVRNYLVEEISYNLGRLGANISEEPNHIGKYHRGLIEGGHVHLLPDKIHDCNLRLMGGIGAIACMEKFGYGAFDYYMEGAVKTHNKKTIEHLCKVDREKCSKWFWFYSQTDTNVASFAKECGF